MTPKKKSAGSIRTAKFGANSLIALAIFIAILSIINFILARHELRFDFSGTGTFSLSDQTQNVLTNLNKPVKITGFFSEQSVAKTRALDLFKNYTHQSDQLSYVVIDPDKKPVIAKNYGVSDYDTVIVESQGRSSALRNITEEALTSALIRVSRESTKTFYFVEGHGEHDIDDGGQDGYGYIKDTLQKQGFVVKKLFLLAEKTIPADASVVVIAGPKRSFTAEEQLLLKNYLESEGQFFLLLDPVLDPKEATGLEDLVAAWGAKMDNGLILDPSSGRITIPTMNPGSYLPHEITQNFNLATFFPVSRAVFFDAVRGQGYRYDPFLETHPEAWYTQELSGDLEVDPDRDQQGRIQFGGVISSTGASKMRMVIIGDSDFANNGAARSAGNGDLFLNILSWLANESDLISIRPKEVPTATLLLSPNQINTIFTVSVLILPIGVMGIGLYIWRGRRRL